jgi:predicted TIM-barrel fold metal-dependent hydrolase
VTRCDSHVHVVGPPDDMIPSRTYTPQPAPLARLQAQAAPLGIGRFVIVQPSFYGADNSLLLDTLDALGSQGRGVAVIDPDAASPETLAAMHRRGVRGLRINLYSTLSAQHPRPLAEVFAATAAVATRMDWHIEVLAGIDLLARHADLLAAAAAPVVIDHFGLYAGNRPDGGAGRGLLILLRRRHVWMKLSAPYRVKADPLAIQPDPAWLAALLDAGADRCVWGSDWPHTPPHEAQTGRGVALPYRALAYADVVAGFRAAIGDDAQADAIMTGNAARLYGFT